MRHIEGENRDQGGLFPEMLEDYVGPDHPVRVIDAFVDSLDLQSMQFSKAQTKETGRKPYSPGDLLKLYIYGYLNRVTTSRRLEAECRRNVEVMWLMRRLAPDFKTIADFRKDNGHGIREACRSFIQFCRKAQLLSGSLVAIDGSKFKAAASKDQVLTRKQLERDQAAIAKQVQSYLTHLDEMDREDGRVQLERDRVEQALQTLRDQSDRLDSRGSAMDEVGRNEHCATEPQARLLRSGREGIVLGYNVQVAVDADTGMILHHDVTDEPVDSRQLQPMAEGAKAALGADQLMVVGDKGYSNGEQFAACEQQGIKPAVPRRVIPNSNKDLYQKGDFDYDAKSDRYRCPAGEYLRYSHNDRRRKLRVYRRTGCDQCPLQPKCTKANARTVSRHFHEDAFDRSEARLAKDPTLLRQRMHAAERPFALLKQAMALRRFVCWGQYAAGTEMAIAILSYNINRTISRVGVHRMLALLA